MKLTARLTLLTLAYCAIFAWFIYAVAATHGHQRLMQIGLFILNGGMYAFFFIGIRRYEK